MATDMTKKNSDLEHMEITGTAEEAAENAAAAAASNEKPTGGVSQWFLQKLKPAPCGDLQDVSCGGNADDTFQPLKLNNSHETTPSGRTVTDYDLGGDMEESSQQERSGEGDLTGIEVEIGSSCSNDDCLYRKRYLNTVWALYKRQILLGCAFVAVFLFGVLIGACGSGQCGAKGGGSDTEASALKAQLGDECNGDHVSVSGVTTKPGTDLDENAEGPYDKPSTVSNPITNAAPTFFGPNVFVFDPSMTTAEIQSRADAIFYQQQNNEMGTERYSLLFQPGTYGSVDEPLMLQIGYYTEISGLGESPRDVQILGKIEVYNRVSCRRSGVCDLFLLFGRDPQHSLCLSCFQISVYQCCSALNQIHTPMASSFQPATRKKVFALH